MQDLDRLLRGVVCAGATLLGALVGLGGRVDAQGHVPSAHFGRDVYPRPQPELRFAFSTDRFTEFEDPQRKFSPKYNFTTGFNFASLIYTDYLLDHSDLTYTVTASPGWSGDEPSRWLQNQYLHGLRNLPVVPVGNVRESEEYAMGGEVNWWLHDLTSGRNQFARPAVMGLGIAASTIYSEAYFHVGVAQAIDIGTHAIVLRGLVRQSWPHEGDAFRDLANTSTLYQGTLEIVPEEVHTPSWLWVLLGNPSVGVTLTQDSGIFEDGADDPIEIQFMSFHIEWATGLRVETYNDLPNDTDMGPSFGLAVSFDVTTLFGGIGRRL